MITEVAINHRDEEEASRQDTVEVSLIFSLKGKPYIKIRCAAKPWYLTLATRKIDTKPARVLAISFSFSERFRQRDKIRSDQYIISCFLIILHIPHLALNANVRNFQVSLFHRRAIKFATNCSTLVAYERYAALLLIQRRCCEKLVPTWARCTRGLTCGSRSTRDENVGW